MSESIPSPAPEQEIKHLSEQCSILLRENERLRAEVERLRVALQVTANNLDSVGAHHYAAWTRAALDDKEV
jgi:regulator of replication initiation timing